jgi:proteasome lid subunit RPN8/RPN11
MHVDLATAVEGDPLRRRLLHLALFEAPYEAAGLITLGKLGRRVRRAQNAAENPRTSFAIAPLELERLLQYAAVGHEKLEAVFHSHPNSGPEPSERDLVIAREAQRSAPGLPGLAMVIVGLHGGECEPTISVTWP